MHIPCVQASLATSPSQIATNGFALLSQWLQGGNIGLVYKLLQSGRTGKGKSIALWHSHMTIGLICLLLKLLTEARLVIETIAIPHLESLCQHPMPTVADRITKLYSDFCL